MAATGNEIVSIAQAAEALGIEAQTSGATGGEAVRLRQLKMVRDSGAGGKKYKIETDGGFLYQVQSSASAGDVVITAAGRDVIDYSVLELIENSPSLGKKISNSYTTPEDATIDDLPQIVQEALANTPQIMAPPPTRYGYSWFIMPPCDVFLLCD